MKKILGLMLFSVILLGVSSCKTKQKVETISGAMIDATSKTNDAASASRAATNVANATPEAEVIRNEKFSLTDGGSNSTTFYKKYHVVVGSFSQKQNAINLQKTLINEGNNALVVQNESGMYRVIISSYDEYNQAKYKITQINNRFPDAWVLMQK